MKSLAIPSGGVVVLFLALAVVALGLSTAAAPLAALLVLFAQARRPHAHLSNAELLYLLLVNPQEVRHARA